MNTGLIWRVPWKTAAIIPTKGYFLVAILVFLLVPFLSAVIGLSETIGVPLPRGIALFLEVLSFSWFFSWIGFLVAWPVAVLARHFGYIGFLPLTLCVAVSSVILPLVDTRYYFLFQANVSPQSMQDYFSAFAFTFGTTMIFAVPFWLITALIWPEAFDNGAGDQQ